MTDLHAERVEDHILNGCDIKVKNNKVQGVQPGHHF